MPNLTLPSGLSVPLPNVSLPYMPSATAGTIPMSLSVAPTMPAVNQMAVDLAALSVSGLTPAVNGTQLDTSAAAAQCKLFC